MQNQKKSILPWILLSVMMLIGQQAEAHPMPNSVVSLSILENSIRGEAKIPLAEWQSAVGEQSFTDLNSVFFKKYFTTHIVVRSGEHTWNTEIENIELLKHEDPMIGKYQEILVHFILTPYAGESLRHFTLQYDAVIHQVVTHKALVFIKSDWSNGLQEESESQPVGILETDFKSGKLNTLKVNLDEGSWWKGFQGMFLFGMNHIRKGLDHILFLLTLLLIAPLTITSGAWSTYQGLKYTLSRFLKISLAFTFGHSITLLAGSFNILHFHAQYIEVLIAFSILISAINCIKPVFFKKEILIAGGFGLIHGLAFSISLSNLELGTGGKIISLLGFNLGIEAMQLMIMGCFFPILLISKLKIYLPLRVSFASFTIIIAIAWVIERIINHENILTHYVSSILG